MNVDILYKKLKEIMTVLKAASDSHNETVRYMEERNHINATEKSINKAIFLLKTLIDIKDPIISPVVTVDQAKKIMETLTNGHLQNISPGKNGRAWMDGEFELCHLEAICVLVRDKAGDNAEGAKELYEYWERSDMLND